MSDAVELWREEFARRNAVIQRADEQMRRADDACRTWIGDDDEEYDRLVQDFIAARKATLAARATG